MDYDDDMYVSNRKRRRAFLYGSFLLCLLGAALGSAAFGTQFWYQADVTNLDDDAWQGKFNTGLFNGKSTLVGLAPSVFIYHISGTDGLLSHGLWAGTIACLSLGLLFAVLGAVFAVVNTATTPVEAITGIPGLYMWNGLAALFELVAVICWAVQFNSHLTSNVLIVDSLGGWTTEGGEALGYSFWLVVVAVVVHVANCALIGFGTYEPKIKEKIQEPDKANNDILLY